MTAFIVQTRELPAAAMKANAAAAHPCAVSAAARAIDVVLRGSSAAAVTCVVTERELVAMVSLVAARVMYVASRMLIQALFIVATGTKVLFAVMRDVILNEVILIFSSAIKLRNNQSINQSINQ